MTTTYPASTPDSIAAALIAELTADAAHDPAAFRDMIASHDTDHAADIIIDDARDSDLALIFTADDSITPDSYYDALHDDRTRTMIIDALTRLASFHSR